jgi:spore coat polysaccharide biosynthesis protein SpsF (cytidylyltransferase family)
LKILAVIQCIAEDVHSSNPDNYCISPLKKADFIDNIVLAVPKLGNFSIFDKLTKKWQVDVFYGSNYNVADRIYNASKKYSPDLVIRVLLRRFYIDLDLVKTMISKIKKGYDYVNLDNNVYNEVAADVSTFKALALAVKLLKKLPNSYQANTFRFNPWRFMECSNKFKITTLKYKKKWSRTRFNKVQQKIKKLFENEEDAAQPVDQNEPVNRYRFISKFIKKNDVVLDIACGRGGGSEILSHFAKEVYGIDYNPNYISYAESEFNRSNLKFILGTDELLEDFKSKFTKVISAHTMEHVPDDHLFLQRIKHCLKSNGKLILEVPRLAPHPLGKPLWPHHKREYTKRSLEHVLKKTGFKIERAFGANRRNYVNVKNARDSFLYVCKISKN